MQIRDYFFIKIIRSYHECEGWNRKFHHEDHRLTSQVFLRDDKRWSGGTDFSIQSSHK